MAASPPTRLNNHDVEIGAQEVPRGQAVENGVAEAQLVGQEIGENEGPDLERDRVMIRLDLGEGVRADGAADRRRQEERDLVEGEARDQEHARHPEALLRLVFFMDEQEVAPEGDKQQREKQEAAAEIGQPARPPMEPLVVEIEDLHRLGAGLVALADDDPALLDRIGHGGDAGPGLRLPALRLDLVVGDVGRQEDLGQAREEGFGFLGDLDLSDLLREPVLAFLEVQDIADLDRSFPVLEGEESQAARPARRG